MSNVYDGGTGNTVGNSYIALSTLNAWVQLDFGSVLTVTGASFYGVNDGDQADTVSIVCGNFPSYQASGAVYMAGTDTTPAAIPRTNSYTGVRYRDDREGSSNVPCAYQGAGVAGTCGACGPM